LNLQYRFKQSDYVHAITITEEAAQASIRTIRPESSGCGETMTLSSAPGFYGRGAANLKLDAAAGAWLACVRPGADVHVVLILRDAVLIQLRAFPEAGLGKDEVLKIAASMRQMP
jgi:hypothetical protein